MRMAFLIFDANGDGVLNKEEITAMLKKLDPELANNETQLEEVFQHMDKDGNGTIDYLEFVEAIKDRFFD
jgi:Ca2+-binding EF-hand superfamily protein